MKYQRMNDTYAVRLEVGDEIIKSIAELCKKEGIKTAVVRGIGAVNRVDIGYYSTEDMMYHNKVFEHQYEIIDLNGNITVKNDEPYLHLHIALSDENYSFIGGHLNSAVISITGEIFITVADGVIERRINPDTGLNILDV